MINGCIASLFILPMMVLILWALVNVMLHITLKGCC